MQKRREVFERQRMCGFKDQPLRNCHHHRTKTPKGSYTKTEEHNTKDTKINNDLYILNEWYYCDYLLYVELVAVLRYTNFESA